MLFSLPPQSLPFSVCVRFFFSLSLAALQNGRWQITGSPPAYFLVGLRVPALPEGVGDVGGGGLCQPGVVRKRPSGDQVLAVELMDRSFDVLGAKLNHISKRPRFQLVAVVCVYVCLCSWKTECFSLRGRNLLGISSYFLRAAFDIWNKEQESTALLLQDIVEKRMSPSQKLIAQKWEEVQVLLAPRGNL